MLHSSYLKFKNKNVSEGKNKNLDNTEETRYIPSTDNYKTVGERKRKRLLESPSP